MNTQPSTNHRPTSITRLMADSEIFYKQCTFSTKPSWRYINLDRCVCKTLYAINKYDIYIYIYILTVYKAVPNKQQPGDTARLQTSV